MPSPDHFKGKSVSEHLSEARKKGALSDAEVHGTEMPGHFAAGVDAVKEMALALLLLWIIGQALLPPKSLFLLLLFFSVGWLIWKTGRSALLARTRIERLHRIAEEERWEIEHHRSQEREELTALYRAKGLSGKLLEGVIDVLMADDNRLLQVMLEEEMGVTLEIYEHPLKQGIGATLGAFIAAGILLGAYLLSPIYGLPVGACLCLIGAVTASARAEKSPAMDAVVWHLAIAILTGGAVYFFMQLFKFTSS